MGIQPPAVAPEDSSSTETKTQLAQLWGGEGRLVEWCLTVRFPQELKEWGWDSFPNHKQDAAAQRGEGCLVVKAKS